jgi:2-dehydro-3-deoxygluconokinase
VSETPQVLTLGEALVSFRAPGVLALGRPLVPRLAGAESNVAIGLARLGHRVRWVGRVGRDAFGDLLVRELRAEGVQTRHVVRDEAPTGMMFLEQRTVDLARVEYRRSGSAGSRITRADVEAAFDGIPAIVHLTGITPALSDAARDATLAAAHIASAAGALVSLDVNYRARLWRRDQARTALAELLPHVGLVIASEDELDLVRDGEEPSAVAALLEAGVAQVAVKRGARGASLWTAEGRFDQPPLAVRAVDTVGAGDAFCTGFLSGLLDGLDGLGCLERGTTLGAFAVSTVGDWEGLPHRAELSQLSDHTLGSAVR